MKKMKTMRHLQPHEIQPYANSQVWVLFLTVHDLFHSLRYYFSTAAPTCRLKIVYLPALAMKNSAWSSSATVLLPLRIGREATM